MARSMRTSAAAAAGSTGAGGEGTSGYKERVCITWIQANCEMFLPSPVPARQGQGRKQGDKRRSGRVHKSWRKAQAGWPPRVGRAPLLLRCFSRALSPALRPALCVCRRRKTGGPGVQSLCCPLRCRLPPACRQRRQRLATACYNSHNACPRSTSVQRSGVPPGPPAPCMSLASRPCQLAGGGRLPTGHTLFLCEPGPTMLLGAAEQASGARRHSLGLHSSLRWLLAGYATDRVCGKELRVHCCVPQPRGRWQHAPRRWRRPPAARPTRGCSQLRRAAWLKGAACPRTWCPPVLSDRASSGGCPAVAAQHCCLLAADYRRASTCRHVRGGNHPAAAPRRLFAWEIPFGVDSSRL